MRLILKAIYYFTRQVHRPLPTKKRPISPSRSSRSHNAQDPLSIYQVESGKGGLAGQADTQMNDPAACFRNLIAHNKRR